MTNTNTASGAADFTDVQYLEQMANHYASSPVPEIRAHQKRLRAIAAALASAAAPAQQPNTACAALPAECDSPELCAVSRSCAGQFGTKRICASRGQAPAGAAEEVDKALNDYAQAFTARAMGWTREHGDALPDARTKLYSAISSYARGLSTTYPTPQADSQPAPARDYPPLPDFDTVEQHIYGACRRYITQDMLEPIHNLIRDAIDAAMASKKGGEA